MFSLTRWLVWLTRPWTWIRSGWRREQSTSPAFYISRAAKRVKRLAPSYGCREAGAEKLIWSWNHTLEARLFEPKITEMHEGRGYYLTGKLLQVYGVGEPTQILRTLAQESDMVGLSVDHPRGSSWLIKRSQLKKFSLQEFHRYSDEKNHQQGDLLIHDPKWFMPPTVHLELALRKRNGAIPWFRLNFGDNFGMPANVFDFRERKWMINAGWMQARGTAIPMVAPVQVTVDHIPPEMADQFRDATIVWGLEAP